MQQQQQQRQMQRPPQAPTQQMQMQMQSQRPRGVSFPEGMPAPSRGGPFQLPPYAGQDSTYGGMPSLSHHHHQQQRQPQQQPQQQRFGAPEEIEYPLPGSVASCDSCGAVVDRYYHCADCREETGPLFDLCVRCCGVIYLQGGQKLPHPTHNYGTHQMQHVVPVN